MTNQQMTIKGKFSYRLGGWKYSGGVRFLLFFGIALLLYLSLAGKWLPQTYEVTLGAPASTTIYAPKQMENMKETQKAREQAAAQVQPVYEIVPLHQEKLVERLYDRLETLNNDKDLTLNEKISIVRIDIPKLLQDYLTETLKNVQSDGRYTDGFMAEVSKRVNEQQYRIPEETYYKLPKLTGEDLAAMEPVTTDIVKKLTSEQIMDATSSRIKVAELVNSSQLSKSTQRELVQEIIRFVLLPNRFYDQEETDQLRAETKEKTPPVFTKKNDILVEKGEVISEDLYKRLEDAGLLKGKVNYFPQIGLALLALMFALGLYMFIRQSHLQMKTNNAQLLMLGLIILLNVIAMDIVALGQNLEYSNAGYLAPVAMGAMLIAILLDVPLALMCSILFSIIASVIFNLDSARLFDYRFGLVSMVMCVAAIFSINRASQRAAILKAGIMVSLFAALTVAGLSALQYSAETVRVKEVVFSLGFAVSSGLLTAVLVIGLLPFIESAFGILSSLKLVELSNPNHPLLRKLLTETPGTYHHSIMVGNLSEAAAEAVGANGLLCRVGSFYHDIGKTRRPGYFIENQTNMDNPHDRIDPALSKSIIVAHARDGVEMLKEHKMPKAICDIAEQHHGTTLLKYFYHKALKRSGDDGAHKITEEEYRYPGPKAQSKEAAIVGIADSVEAAVRSLRSPTIEQIDGMVRKIIKDRMDDGQFNDCDLTMKELDVIAKTLNEALLGIFHSRIEYPAEMPAKDKEPQGAPNDK
ncbi:HD family phosphohydrolase [Paenibacillus sp. y28]|uniref:HD family phosphohydrolase n=1 Tax=Paenibacillus sp. y28 TaxID=3129110 RepID=UPI003019C325